MSMLKYIFPFLFGFLLCINVHALPSSRPLPSRLSTTGHPFIIMRDHEKDYGFYILPKEMQVTEEKIRRTIGIDPDCQIVKNYQELREQIQSLSNLIAETENQELQKRRDKIKRLRALDEKIYEIQDQLLEEQLTNEAGDQVERLKAILTQLESAKAKIESDLSNFQIDADNPGRPELQAAVSNLSKLREAGNELSQQLPVPVAELSIELTTKSPAEWSSNWREDLGFLPTDQILPLPVVGLELKPQNDLLTRSILDEINLKETLGRTDPRWSERSIDFRNSSLIDSDIVGLGRTDLPRQINFEQTLSLFYYCLSNPEEGQETPITRVPLQISYRIKQWMDETLPNYNIAQLAHFKAKLTNDQWQRIWNFRTEHQAEMPTLNDPGQKKFFKGIDGAIKPKQIQMEINRRKEK